MIVKEKKGNVERKRKIEREKENLSEECCEEA
jgi:hypothetical protein